MKYKKLAKLRYNIWFYFIIFAIILLAIVWISQILFFDRVYQRKKFDTISNIGEKLSVQLNTSETITDSTLNTWLNTAVEANEAGIYSFLAFYDENNKLVVETIYSGFIISNNSGYNGLNSDNLGSETETTVDNTDKIIATNAIDALITSNSDYVCYQYKENQKKDGAFYVYATSVNNELINGYLILRTSQQALLETVSIIQTQLIIISVIIVIIAFFLSYYISTKVSKPIIQMSNTAKQWASGDESVVFSNDSYQELSELCETLNYSKEAISKTGVLQRDLLANVSHDLKTPLTMIKAYAEMIRDLSGEIKEKRDAHTNVIIDEADRLTMLVNDILDLSKLQSQTQVQDLQVVNLSSLCERVLHRFNGFAEQSGYKIVKEIEPELYTFCDEKKIEQVVYNLVGNSINYTGSDKTIFVKLSLNNDVVLFESIDSGKGISQENVETIWEKYYRFSDTHQRPIKGTGLGLSIVKTILENHRVKFGVISKKDIGSNFFIQFKHVTNSDKESDIE